MSLYILLQPGWCMFVLLPAPTLALCVQVCGFCSNLNLKDWGHFYNQVLWKPKFLSGTEGGIFPGMASVEWSERAWRNFHLGGKMDHHYPRFTAFSGSVYEIVVFVMRPQLKSVNWNISHSQRETTETVLLETVPFFNYYIKFRVQTELLIDRITLQLLMVPGCRRSSSRVWTLLYTTTLQYIYTTVLLCSRRWEASGGGSLQQRCRLSLRRGQEAPSGERLCLCLLRGRIKVKISYLTW